MKYIPWRPIFSPRPRPPYLPSVLPKLWSEQPGRPAIPWPHVFSCLVPLCQLHSLCRLPPASALLGEFLLSVHTPDLYSNPSGDSVHKAQLGSSAERTDYVFLGQWERSGWAEIVRVDMDSLRQQVPGKLPECICIFILFEFLMLLVQSMVSISVLFLCF